LIVENCPIGFYYRPAIGRGFQGNAAVSYRGERGAD